MATELEHISRAYRELLHLPPGAARMNLQPTLCALRDEIAYMTGHPKEGVQNAFEAWAATTHAIDQITR